MSYPESKLQLKIQRELRKLGCWVHKNHGNAYSVAGLPDLTVIRKLIEHEAPTILASEAIDERKAHLMSELIRFSMEGKTFWLEVKMPGEKLSHIQEATHRKMKSHGAAVFMVTSVEEAREVVFGPAP